MAGLVPPAVLEQIRSANDIVDVIGAAIPLKRNGANFVALCPFHREKTPSFNVSSQRQSFHCFGCHKGGDVFTFLREYENLSFMEAVKRLAERANITLEFENNPDYQRSRAVKDELLALHEHIAQRWHQCLLNDAGAQPARDYLESRAVPADAVATFRLGYAPDAWDDTVNWGRSKKFDPALLEQAGLIIRREGGDGHYDRFRGRLIFPIADEQGRVIGFSGRVLDPEAKTAKYVNSPETPIFTKGRVFFGLDKSKRALLDEQRAIVCEGQLDLIRAYLGGVRNIVAPQGTALTAEHARILKRYVEEVVLCFDADAAGQNAAERSFESLVEVGLAVRVARVPPPHDPDSFIRQHGGEAFQKIVAEAMGYFDFLLDRLCGENDPRSDRGRMAIVAGMARALQQANNQVLTDTYTRKTALRLGVSPEAVQQEFRKARRDRRPTRNTEEPDLETLADAEAKASRPDALELWLLRILLRSEDLAEWFSHHLDPGWLEHPLTVELVNARLSLHDASPAALIGELPHEAARALASEILVEDRELPEPARQARDVVLKLRNRHFDAELGRLLSRTASGSLDDQEQVALLHQMEALRRTKRTPLAPLADS
ncbi:MAG TPA: DNA primase [Verrucomicrobiales bacterium]|nr:DNA primase [Verrucomicrobiales bacterium]